MKFAFPKFKNKNKSSNTNNAKDQALLKIGREQFKTLLKKGLTIPVVLL